MIAKEFEASCPIPILMDSIRLTIKECKRKPQPIFKRMKRHTNICAPGGLILNKERKIMVHSIFGIRIPNVMGICEKVILDYFENPFFRQSVHLITSLIV